MQNTAFLGTNVMWKDLVIQIQGTKKPNSSLVEGHQLLPLVHLIFPENEAVKLFGVNWPLSRKYDCNGSSDT